MTEIEVKKELSPLDIYQRNIETMTPRQMRGHLRRKARQKGSMIDSTFAIVLSTIFENVNLAGAGGNTEPYLR